MTTYISAGTTIGGYANGTLGSIEDRVQSNILQQILAQLSPPNSPQQDDLRVLRNDQAYELGFVPAVVPGN